MGDTLDGVPPGERTVRIGPKGRIVLPAEARRAIGVEEGDEVVIIPEDDMLVLMTREAAIARLRHLIGESDRSAVDELMDLRRAEGRRDAGDG
jgi:AbrB family looped-hinge helix DNA binding protein